MTLEKMIINHLNAVVKLLLTSDEKTTNSKITKDIEVIYAATGMLLRKHYAAKTSIAPKMNSH